MLIGGVADHFGSPVQSSHVMLMIYAIQSYDIFQKVNFFDFSYLFIKYYAQCLIYINIFIHNKKLCFFSLKMLTYVLWSRAMALDSSVTTSVECFICHKLVSVWLSEYPLWGSLLVKSQFRPIMRPPKPVIQSCFLKGKIYLYLNISSLFEVPNY